MNPIAQRALEQARAARTSALSLSPAPAPAQVAPTQPLAPAPELVITGPINQFMLREGRQYAADVVRSMGLSVKSPEAVARTIRNLTETALAQPSSHAAGIKQVIDMLLKTTTQRPIEGLP